MEFSTIIYFIIALIIYDGVKSFIRGFRAGLSGYQPIDNISTRPPRFEDPPDPPEGRSGMSFEAEFNGDMRVTSGVNTVWIHIEDDGETIAVLSLESPGQVEAVRKSLLFAKGESFPDTIEDNSEMFADYVKNNPIRNYGKYRPSVIKDADNIEELTEVLPDVVEWEERGEMKRARVMVIREDWDPRDENIYKLPEPIKSYIYKLQRKEEV